MNKFHAAITAEGLELIAKHQEQVNTMMEEHAKQLGYAVGPPMAQPAPVHQVAPSARDKDSPLQQAKQRAAEKAAEKASGKPAQKPEASTSSPSQARLHIGETPQPQDKKPVTATPSPLQLARARAAARTAETSEEPARKRLNFNQGMTMPPSRASE